MAAFLVVDGENIEKERLNIVVECLVVQEQLGEKAQILTVDLVHVTVNFKDRQVLVAINFVGRRMI